MMGMSAGSELTGQLLVATPQIDEGIFYRCVVLLLHHGPDGAQGVVLGRALPALVDAVLPGWGSSDRGSGMLFQGGPVEVDSALAVAQVPGIGEPLPGVRGIFSGIGLVDLDSDPALVLPTVERLRVFAGYSGWAPGQLEMEIARGSWYVVARAVGDAFAPAECNLWREVLARQRGPLALVATYPADPGLN